jgi:hypothetical protein
MLSKLDFLHGACLAKNVKNFRPIISKLYVRETRIKEMNDLNFSKFLKVV